MGEPLKIYGAEMSPYSVKVRSFMRYKQLPHVFLSRSFAREAEFAALAKLPLIPLVVDADGVATQDSTPIIEGLEARHPEPATQPEDPRLAFLSNLVEEYADEWLNKAMFHYRWTGEADRYSAAGRILDMMLEGAELPDRARALSQITERMVSRLHFVGSNPETAPVIEGAFQSMARLLDAHLAKHLYLFGGRPSLADFSLAGQFHQLLSDPTPGAFLRSECEFVVRWTEFMADPKPGGPFEPLSDLADTLMPFLRQEVGEVFLPWALANAEAVGMRADRMTVTLHGQSFPQAPQKYASRSFYALVAKYGLARDTEGLADLLGDIGAHQGLEQAWERYQARQEAYAARQTERAQNASADADVADEAPADDALEGGVQPEDSHAVARQPEDPAD